MSPGEGFTHDTTEAHVARLENHIGDLEKQISDLRNDIKGLVEAWKAAGLVIAVIKWLAVLGAAIVAIKAGFNALKPH